MIFFKIPYLSIYAAILQLLMLLVGAVGWADVNRIVYLNAERQQ